MSAAQVVVSSALIIAPFALIVEVTLFMGLVSFTFFISFESFWVYVYRLWFREGFSIVSKFYLSWR